MMKLAPYYFIMFLKMMKSKCSMTYFTLGGPRSCFIFPLEICEINTTILVMMYPKL